MIKGEPVRLAKRGLSEEICRKFRIHKDGEELRFHYYDQSGQICGAKVKTKDKTFRWDGKNTDHQLFGQHLFPDKGTRLTIYEGELDAASGYAAMPTWPHVSLPDGAQSAKRALQRVMPLLQSYEEIVLFFDNDEPGRKAAEECAQLLPPGKVKIARMEKYKDASDALQASDSEAIRRAVWDAKTYRPDGIVDAKTLLDLVSEPLPPCAHDYPFQGIQDKLHGIRYGELVTITAGSGIGKSSFCRELATHLLNKGERVGYVALEESNRRTALGLMSAHCGKSFHLGEHDRSTLTQAYQDTLAKWNLYLFDGFGSFDPDVIYNRIEYLATGLEVRCVFLDHLSILLSGLDGDERRMIDTTMTKLRSLVERTGISLFLVSHLRRTSNDTNHEEGARVHLGQLRGSAAIAQLSDAVIALERNQQADRGASGTTVRILKNRYSGEVGVACYLDYDLDTCKFHETEPEPEFDPTTDF
jgi:twinkle protein